MPEGYGQSKQYPLSKKMSDIRKELEEELRIPENSVFMENMTGAKSLQDCHPHLDKCLHELGLNADDKVSIQLKINYYQSHMADDYKMPDTLQFPVQNQDGETTMVNVHVSKASESKPYLGGFKDNRTDIVYHHGCTQTAAVAKKEHAVKNHRETQTYDMKTRSTQSKREFGTQMAKVGLYIDDSNDREMTPGPYFSSADFAAVKVEAVLVIQCHARGMFARLRSSKKRLELIAKNSRLNQEAHQANIDMELRHKREIHRRMHPRTHEDFKILYAELEAWRVMETQKIKDQQHSKEVKQLARKLLLYKETKLLQTIDRLKIEATHANRDAKIEKELKSMTEPKVWAQGDGETTTVYTPFTTRAKELQDLYKGLRLENLSTDERLDVLLHVKWTVKEFDCNLTRDIVQLVDREADLLNRGRSAKTMRDARKRLSNLFLNFCTQPQYFFFHL